MTIVLEKEDQGSERAIVVELLGEASDELFTGDFEFFLFI